MGTGRDHAQAAQLATATHTSGRGSGRSSQRSPRSSAAPTNPAEAAENATPGEYRSTTVPLALAPMVCTTNAVSARANKVSLPRMTKRQQSLP